MSASLLDTLTGLITPDVVGKAASILGESDSAIRRGIGGAFAALLSGVATRSDDAGFASSLFDLVRSPANDGSVLNDVGSLFSAGGTSPMLNLGGKLLSSLFEVMTFAVLLVVFDATESVFRTGWFVESLLSELVIAIAPVQCHRVPG